MSTYYVSAVPGNGSQVNSGHGTLDWRAPNASLIAVTIGPSNGSKWYVWQVTVPNAVVGETVTNIRMEGSHDYLVGGGGAGITRQAVLHIAYGPSLYWFTGGIGTAAAGVTGSGTGVDIVMDMPITGFSGTDLINGGLYVGFAVKTDASNPGDPWGDYRNSSLFWTITTTPPPAGTPSATITPVAANVTPGVLPGAQFASTRADWVPNGVGSQANIQFQWSIAGAAGVTFAANGGTSYTVQKGTTYDPANWYWANSGLLNIAAGAAAGTRTLSCTIVPSAYGSIIVSTSLVVRAGAASAGLGLFGFAEA